MNIEIIEYIAKAFLVLVIAWVLLPALASVGASVLSVFVWFRRDSD